ncbi:MAG: ubiquinol-cytochrome C reductase [Bdellovibrionaceae bacterium]|nr:ubiquinol-cytochrome C reductase [Pseudobdellovibrionaceae bacterium]
MKTEPSTYSFDDLVREKKTSWDGVRNYQARNYLKECQKGDSVLIYHSVQQKAVVGTAEVLKEAYPDPDPSRKGDWVKVDIKPLCALKKQVELQQIKQDEKLSQIPLVTHSRLSVMPLKKVEFDRILKLGGL